MNKTAIRLSKLQQQVVDFDNGALLVVAGPGSGKTRVLTERVRRLVSQTNGHFRVLALTFTNKAANEMSERLSDLGDLSKRAMIGTVHGFCLEMLADRGQPLGITSSPQIFEQYQDRRQIFANAIASDPELSFELAQAGDAKARSKRVDQWLRLISVTKTNPLSQPTAGDGKVARIIEAYDAGLSASGAIDFDDLLLLGYRLLTEYPKIAGFYRRLYGYICIDEAQDLNEAQYALIQALCGDELKNLMMVGDPKQSIFGFNTSSPEFMDRFVSDFDAATVELTDNFRCSKTVVEIAKVLEPTYVVDGQLPITGEAGLLVGHDELDEARLVTDKLVDLIQNGHPDIEGISSPSQFAVLGRTRYALLAIEAELQRRNIPFYKRISSLHENASEVASDFHLALRLLANPKDKLHFAALLKRWDHPIQKSSATSGADVVSILRNASHGNDAHTAVVDALAIIENAQRLDLKPSVAVLQEYADTLDDDDKAAIYGDVEVVLGEWDQYLRSGSGGRTIGGFLSSLALGTTQQPKSEGVALLTVHSSKGLEFEGVVLAGMAEGVFPDYRANGKRKEMAEEDRNAFVAVTRSKRLLFFSYPQTRKMPWGDIWKTRPSPYLTKIARHFQQ